MPPSCATIPKSKCSVSYSITSLAIMGSVCGIFSPSVLAVLRSKTSSYSAFTKLQYERLKIIIQ